MPWSVRARPDVFSDSVRRTVPPCGFAGKFITMPSVVTKSKHTDGAFNWRPTGPCTFPTTTTLSFCAFAIFFHTAHISPFATGRSHCTHCSRDWSFTQHTSAQLNVTNPNYPLAFHFFHLTHLYQFPLGHSNAFNLIFEQSNGAQPWTTAEPSAVHPVKSIQCKTQWRSAMEDSGTICCAPSIQCETMAFRHG